MKKQSFYAPDNLHEWEDMGSACKKYWPDGIPSFVITKDGEWLYKEYAGNVWRTNLKLGEELNDEKLRQM